LELLFKKSSEYPDRECRRKPQQLQPKIRGQGARDRP